MSTATPTAVQDVGSGPISAKDLADMPKALLILAAQIQAPDHVPSMCLRDAATMIQSLASQLAQAQEEVERKTVELDRLRNHGNQNRKIRVLCNESIADGYIRLVDEQEAELATVREECERLRKSEQAFRDQLRAENAELEPVLQVVQEIALTKLPCEEATRLCFVECSDCALVRKLRSALPKHQQGEQP